ncbi:NUDIX hydrolase [Alteribacter lacisalsi]|uniref:NUDIX hydrolase n=1 Tax=Alteribacter lacisalsi TaxID=2045244 RepID=A0A2W0HFI7_9BACI|nr:NUDIX domain-containing protein [Alteribacter lacisalsi]PYZ95569.1 NUDIX hydrolase [Alteribacter lacisalsi]
MEKWDVYDRHRQVTGNQMIRGNEFEDGAYHLVVHVCLFNEKGEMLIQQRQSDRDNWPELWDISVGGSALAGETSQEAAGREVEEELGLTLDLRSERPSLTINFENGFDDYYLLNTEADIDDLPLPTEEVQQAVWATEETIIEWINRGVFIPYRESIIRLLFDMRNGFGTHEQ